MMINEEARYDKLPMEEHTLELKTRPSTLKYAFQASKAGNYFVQAGYESGGTITRSIKVEWRSNQMTLTDLKGLNPSLCTHRIFVEDESRPVREAQR